MMSLLFIFVLLISCTLSENNNKIKNAYFAAGCYWSIELAYQRIPGVVETSVGFCGGKTIDNKCFENIAFDTLII